MRCQSISLSLWFWKHTFQDHLHCHRVAAACPALEEVTITLPAAILKVNGMGVIITIESNFQRLETNAVAFLGITLGFFNLSYQG